MSSELADHSATELAGLVRAREVSPVEVLDACLARLERYNPTLNAVVTLNEHARDDARELERRLKRGESPGVLCGLPVGIKDVTPVQGLRTTFGSPLYKDYVPAEDALVVQRLRAAGAVILGKTNTPEFAAGGNTSNEVFGRTRNPWNPSLSAGGSTGGGCAALATGMIALGEGTDLGGSLRIPASFCGVVGIRPSVGLVPTHPSDWVWDDLQVTGPVARTAEDLGLMLQAVAGPSPLALLGLWFVAQMYPRLDQIDRLGVNVANNVKAGLRVTTADLAAGQAARGRMWKEFRELVERFDHLLTPCMAVPPFPVEQNYPETVAGKKMETYVDWLAPTFVLSLTGLPVASVPCGLDGGGLPVGMQIVGHPLGEEAVLALAGVMQELRPIGKPPTLPRSP